MPEHSHLPTPDRQPSNPSVSLEELKCDLAAETLRASGALRLRVTGASMLPTIWPGDVLHVQRARPDGVYIGDVVLFARNGGLVAHRVVGVRKAGDRSQESGDSERKAEGRRQKTAVRSQESKARTQEPGARAEESGARTLETKSREKPQGRSQKAEDAVPYRRSPIPPPVSPTPYPAPRALAQSLTPDPLLVITRGDSVGHDDAPVSIDEVLGLVTAIERRGRRISARLTAWRRAAAAVLGRSEFCTRAAIWLHRRYQGQSDE